MDSADLEVLATVCAWAGAGEPFVLVTVARTWGSAPRAPGSWCAVRRDGRVVGSVSGGCVEDDLIGRVRAGGFSGPGAEVVSYGVTRDEALRLGLPCGGTLELVVEPAPDWAGLAELHARVARGERALRTLALASGAVTLAPAGAADAFAYDGVQLLTLHGPRWRLLVIGAGATSRVLAEMAPALDYQVTVCDPREEYARGWAVTGAELVSAMPDDAVRALSPDPHTAVVALTHDPRLDDLALLEGLRSPAFYVGALGSRASNARRRARLRGLGLSEAEVGRLHGPVGLPIGSRTPAEIAVSVLAELVAVRNGARAGEWGPGEGAGEGASDPRASRWDDCAAGRAG